MSDHGRELSGELLVSAANKPSLQLEEPAGKPSRWVVEPALQDAAAELAKLTALYESTQGLWPAHTSQAPQPFEAEYCR